MTTAQEIELKAAEARPKIEALAIGVATMLRDLAALRKDAERYRWLLAHAVSENDEGEKCIYYRCDFEHYDNVSASIDKAKESQ